MPIILQALAGKFLGSDPGHWCRGLCGAAQRGSWRHGRVMQGYSQDQFFSTLRAFHGESDDYPLVN